MQSIPPLVGSIFRSEAGHYLLVQDVVELPDGYEVVIATEEDVRANSRGTAMRESAFEDFYRERGLTEVLVPGSLLHRRTP